MIRFLISLFCFTLLFSAGLEQAPNMKILHLEGTPFDRGYHHGALLREEIQKNVDIFVEPLLKAEGPFIKSYLAQLPEILEKIPGHFLEEIRGLADGSGISYDKLLLLNLVPELFHCTGLTLKGKATKDGKLYHVRVLDYAKGKNLQETATLMVVHPEGKHGYLNVSYAGFIGSVTGMNDQKIAIGEIGGKGYGNWKGIPMAFLMREVLENASTLGEAKSILEKAERTCEYFYVISDGNSETSCGAYATPHQIAWIEPGKTYELCSKELEKGEEAIYLDDAQGIDLLFDQPHECVAVTGYTNPQRFGALATQLNKESGGIGPEKLMEIIKRPVSMESNLHNAIFCPSELSVWISHAGKRGEPACDQPYFFYSLAQTK